ncbi:hypothetical protein [Paenibacillus sp. QZ-Y1]|uniref:hypothetical protein n=1 Tax=Paenibacillus sp. QZ-Y1 TaxID=3414511 RepID=UPI003F78E641
MKKTMTTLASAVLLGAIAVSAVSAQTSETVDVTTPPVIQNDQVGENNPGPDITLFNIGNNWAQNVNGNKMTSSQFYVPATFGHVKLYFNNKGTSDTIISVTHSSGKVYFTKTVKEGKDFTWRSIYDFPQGVRGGDFTVSYRSSSGNVNVDIAGFASDNVEEVKG